MESSRLEKGVSFLQSGFGQAWEELSQDHTIALRAFKKCGISFTADGSKNCDKNLTRLEEYTCTDPHKPQLPSSKTHLTVKTAMLTVIVVLVKRAVKTKARQTTCTSYHALVTHGTSNPLLYLVSSELNRNSFIRST